MLKLLDIYKNKTSLFVGTGIGLLTYIVSTSLCAFASGCVNGNPYFEGAQFCGSAIVGIYCGWFINGKLAIKVAGGFIVTILTIFAVLKSGARAIFDMSLGGESFASHSLLYGVITLIFATSIKVMNNQPAKK